jgi:serine/threonine-protein kinase
MLSHMPHRLPPPSRLGRYLVRAKIAEGGMATVYVGRLAPDAAPPPLPGSWDVVALKMIKDELSLNKDFVNMFVDEAKIVSRLRHPNIVQIAEMGTEGQRIFLVMELLFGQSLWNVWDACREKKVRLRYDVIAWLGARVAEGLHAAHEMRDEHGRHLEIVHRDVNATNIFVTYDGHVKIIDFGLAKAINRVSKTAAGIIKGKVAYMSPEQAIGSPVDRRTDVFALGTTLWELGTDRRLFKHTDEVETLKRVHAAEVPDPTRLVAGYPPAMWAILRRALARAKEDRYPSAAELARDLDAFARSEGRVVTPPVVAAVMRDLFGDEQERQALWLADASAPDRPAPRETLKPPSGFYAAHDAVDVPRPSAVPRDLVPPVPGGAPAPPAPAKRTSAVGAWIAAALVVVVLLGAAALYAWKR